jgi:adenylylsulfate kinase-like enzyme/SAM-dependent methyltransferase
VSIIEADEHASGVIWVTGYSGAGKTTVAREVERLLRGQGRRVVLLDGDDLRNIFAGRWGYERRDRVELAGVYFRLCSHLAAQGSVVVISAVAMYDEVRAWVRANVPRSLIAYLHVPHDVRVDRDATTKGVYTDGADLESMYDEPSDADLEIANFGDVTSAEAASAIVERFGALAESTDAAVDHGKAEHWARYYSAVDNAPLEPSSFATLVGERLPAGSRVLEIGCGNGRDSAHLARSGHHVVGLDAAPAAIDLCRRTHDGSGAEFVAGPLAEHADGWEDGFDVLYTRFVLHAMTEAEEVALWRDTARVLRPGGQVAIECRSIHDPLARQGEVLSPTERIAGHYRRFIVLEDLRSRLADAGLVVEEAAEHRGVAAHGDDDPVVIRAYARRDGA